MSWHYVNLTLQSLHGDHPVPAFAAFVITGCLVILSFLRGPRTPLVRVFSLSIFSICLWSFGIYQLTVAMDGRQGLFWARALNSVGPFIAPSFFHFATLLTKPRQDLMSRRVILIGYLGAFILLGVSTTPLFIRGTSPAPGFYYYPLPGLFFYIFMAFHMFFAIWAFLRLMRGLTQSGSAANSPIPYVFVAYMCSFLGGSQTFLPGLGLPMWRYAIYTVPAAFLLISYAILNRHLLDFRIVIRKTLIYSLVTVFLTFLYLGIVLGLAWLSQGVFRLSSGMSYALAAGSITLLFHPLRMKVQRFIDRHFFREAMDQEMLREATSGFVHEIKRPLANISLPAELSLMDLRDLADGKCSMQEVLPKVMQRLQYILAQTAEAGDKIEAIRAVSASDPGRAEDLDLAGIIQAGVAAKRSLCQRHHIEVKLDLSGDLPIIRGHAKQLEIVITNLIKNAVEAMSGLDLNEKRAITITAGRSGDHVTMCVQDMGPGIKAEDLPHLFEPYFTTKGSQGMGMGLFLCHQIVQAHGGTIDVMPHTDKGAKFQVVLNGE